MKKVLFFVAVAAFVFLSCERHELETPKSFTFKASIEDFATKANINDANGLVWATGDEIGIYVNEPSWSQKNQPFILDKGAGTTTGEFKWEGTGTFSENAAAAFFPWQGTNSFTDNNVYEGTMYFKLKDSYYGYTSGKMLTPLIASLSGSTDDIKFKHAGAAVKVTINNLPKGAHSIGMTVDGQQIWGDYSINPANAGIDALATSNTDNTKNTLWLNFTPVATAGEFTFVFPVPALTKPKLSFKIYDDNDVLVWAKNLKAQNSDLGRADVLVMPATDITYYQQLKVSNDWGLCSSKSGWSSDVNLLTHGDVCILKGYAFSDGEEFKIRTKGSWDQSFGKNGGNWVVDDASAVNGKVLIFKYSNGNGTITFSDKDYGYPTHPYQDQNPSN